MMKFKLSLVICLLISYKAYSQELNKISVEQNINLSIIDKSFLKNTEALYNYGFSVEYARISNSCYYFSYALGFGQNSTRKLDLLDNRNVVDTEGKIDDSQIKYYDTEVKYSFIMANFKFNYSLLEFENSSIVSYLGIGFKYYLNYQTTYNFVDGKQKAEQKISDLYEGNYLIDNPSILAGIMYNFEFLDSWNISTGFNYSYDVNLIDIPKYHKLGISLLIGNKF